MGNCSPGSEFGAENVSTDASGGTAAPQVELEYSRGTGAFFPAATTQATQTGLQDAVTQLNGQSGNVTLIVVGTAYPASPYVGQGCYRTDLGHLYIWTGSAWGQA